MSALLDAIVAFATTDAMKAILICGLLVIFFFCTALSILLARTPR